MAGLKKCIKATASLGDEDVSAVLDGFDSYSARVTQKEATTLAIDDVILSVQTERTEFLELVYETHPDTRPAAPAPQPVVPIPDDPAFSVSIVAKQDGTKGAKVLIDRALINRDADNFGYPTDTTPLKAGDPRLEDTQKKYTVPGTQHPELPKGSLAYTPERTALHDEWIQGYLDEGETPTDGSKPLAIMTGGGGASGKGTVVRYMQNNGELPREGFVRADPDNIKTDNQEEYGILLQVGDSRAAPVVHEESSDVAKILTNRAIAQKKNIIIDKTLNNRDKTLRQIADLKAAGYEVRLVGVTLGIDEALIRALGRYYGSGRLPLVSHMVNAHISFNAFFMEYAVAVDSASIYDNTDGPVLVVSAEQGSVEIIDELLYNTTVQRGKIDGSSKTLRQVQTDAEVDTQKRSGKDDQRADDRRAAKGARAQEKTVPSPEVTPQRRALPAAALRGGELQSTSAAAQPYDFVQHHPQPANKPKTHLNASTIQGLVDRLQRDQPGMGQATFHIFATQDEAFGPGSAEKHGVLEGGYYSGTDEILIIAEHIRDENHLRQVIRHETIGHYGLRQVLNRDGAYDKLLDRVYKARDGELKDLYDWVAKLYPDLIEDNDFRTIADEMLARAAETGTKTTLLKRIWDQIIKLLNQYGLGGKISYAEVQSLIRSSEANLKKNSEPLTSNQVKDDFERMEYDMYLEFTNDRAPMSFDAWASLAKRGPLPMGAEARKKRARQQGFNTSATWYHGTARRGDQNKKEMTDFDFGVPMGDLLPGSPEFTASLNRPEFEEFEMDFKNIGRNFVMAAPEPALASSFAGTGVSITTTTEGARVIPLYARTKKTFDYENMSPAERKSLRQMYEEHLLPENVEQRMNEVARGRWSEIEGGDVQAWLRAEGYDSFYARERNEKNLGVLNPNQFRSINASFVPRDIDSARLLARRGDPDQTGTPEFKAWFKDSKVVDEAGAPLSVVHGSLVAGFNTFRSFKPQEYGEFFFSDARVAETYSGSSQNVDLSAKAEYLARARPGNYNVFLSLQNPLIIEAEKRPFGKTQTWTDPIGGYGNVPKLVAATRVGGKYDGVIIKNIWDEGPVSDSAYLKPSTIYVAFDPEQIKSSDQNTGAFDPNDPDIRFSRGAPRVSDQPGTTEFKNWFGQSKILDDDGTPKVMYRGEQGEPGAFYPNDKGLIYLTGDKETADKFAAGGMGFSTGREGEGVTSSVYAKADNPLDIIDNEEHYEWFVRAYAEERLDEAWVDGAYTSDPQALIDLARSHPLKSARSHLFEDPALIRRIKDAGYDGILSYEYPIDKRPDQEKVLAVFKSHQVKSATDNFGAFDPTDMRLMFSRGAQEAEDAPTGGNLGMPDETLKDKFVRQAQDNFSRVKQLQKTIRESGGEVSDDADVYRAEERSSGKIAFRLKQLKRTYMDPLTKIMDKNDITLEELDEFLVAKHARERNDWIAAINDEMPDGGSGMSNDEARAVLERAHLGDKEDAFNEAAALVYGVNDQNLDDLVEGGHMSPKTVEAWRSRWDNYVPLKGKVGEEDSISLGTGYSLGKSGVVQALGRGAGNLPESPTAHSFGAAEAAIVRTEKTKVGQALVELIRANPDPELWTISKRTYKKFVNLFGEPFEGYDKPPEGLIEGLDYHRTYAISAQESADAIAEGRDPVKKVVYMVDRHYGDRDDVFKVMVDNEELLINIKDPVLVNQLKKMSVTQLGVLTRFFGQVNRYLAMINTALNPEFVITNFERDFSTAMINLGGEHSTAIAARVAKGIPGAVRGIWQATFDTKGSSAWRDLFSEMEAEGGAIGFFGLEDIDTKVKNIQSSLLNRHGVLGATRRGVMAVRDVVLDANLSVENAARLAAYKVVKEEAIKNGATQKQARATAASVSKNLTVNFNRKGELAPVLNSAYLFYNASIQGSARIITALGSPRVRKIVGGVAATAFALAMYNRAAGDDDDDIPYYDKISDYTKQTNLIVMHPDGSGKYSKIRLPYGYNVFWYAGVEMENLMYNPRATGARSTVNMIAATLNAYNPIQGADLLDTITPTVLKPFEQDVRNINFMSSPLKPESPFDNYDRPESDKAFKSTNPALKEMMAALNEETGGDQTHSGLIDISPEIIKHYTSWLTGGAGMTAARTVGTVVNLATGEEIDPKNVPFLRTVGGSPGSSFDTQRFYDAIKEVNAVEQQLKLHKGTEEYADYKSEHSQVHKLSFRMNKFKNKVKRLRTKRDAAYADDDTDLANDYREQIRQEMMEFNTLYDLAAEEDL